MSRSSKRTRPNPRLLAVGVAVWLAAIVGGMGALADYSFKSGPAALPPRSWPADSTIEANQSLHTLVMVAHPKCSCTRASVAELSRLMTRLQGRVAGHVIFVEPDGTGSDWTQSDLWASASRIDGIVAHHDPGGIQAELFGAKTSGQVYLFDPSGTLLFEGGITPTRAHEGDSVGRQRIVALVLGNETDRDNSLVYGCPIEDEPDVLAQRSVGIGVEK